MSPPGGPIAVLPDEWIPGTIKCRPVLFAKTADVSKDVSSVKLVYMSV